MSFHIIDRYYNKIEKLKRFGGSENELSIRGAFQQLIDDYADKKNLLLIPELRIKGTKEDMVQPDGTLKNGLRLELGYWESKDGKDDIDVEIENKTRKGYPLTNTLFEDTNIAVLFQYGKEVLRVDINDRKNLDKILNKFISFEPPEIYEFHKALEQFKIDLPHILDALRDLLEKESKENKEYISAKEKFLENCQNEINPDFTNEDVREMVIQHILTEEIFNAIFDESHFHMENNIARQLDSLIKTFFTGAKRRNTIDKIKHYYNTISTFAKSIVDHHEKQKFLKVIYENFYKSYNPKAVDRLGVVYTPNEIVKFMIESTDYLLSKHFNKTLSDENVDILDPATGTGTYICDIIEHIPKNKLEYKYKNEIHANEVAILPYYVANLNIEYTYKQKMGLYSEFTNLCFVDTLDNIGGLKYKDKQEFIFGFSSENAERIKRQNEKKISVIIGNPPYNANQKNENENNKNRDYKDVDKRIKETFVYYSKAQKTKVYDMYSRFYRWAMDRLDKNGIIAFVTNRSFINSATFDGFRKYIQDNFDYCFILDTKSDVRLNPKIAGTTHNVFGIQTGVAITFLIRKEESEKKKCRILYHQMDEYLRKEDKLNWIRNNPISSIEFEEIKPDKNNNWLNLSDTNFDDLIPIANKQTKFAQKLSDENAIFKNYSLGIATNRDEWVYGFSQEEINNKIKFFFNIYQRELKRYEKEGRPNKVNDFVDRSIKWTSELEDHLLKGTKLLFVEERIRKSAYRPFISKYLYFDKVIIHRLYQQNEFFPVINKNTFNKVISIDTSNKRFSALSSLSVPNNHFNGDSQCFALYRYDENGTKSSNITDWGLNQFLNNYKDKKLLKRIFSIMYMEFFITQITEKNMN